MQTHRHTYEHKHAQIQNFPTEKRSHVTQVLERLIYNIVLNLSSFTSDIRLILAFVPHLSLFGDQKVSSVWKDNTGIKNFKKLCCCHPKTSYKCDRTPSWLFISLETQQPLEKWVTQTTQASSTLTPNSSCPALTVPQVLHTFLYSLYYFALVYCWFTIIR